jgi:hypothetical protein
MLTHTPRDPWRVTWRVATSDGLLTALLLGVAVGLVATIWLPQMPTADPVAYAQWFSKAQARFGETTPTMETLGLFTVTHSFGFRVLLSLLAGCLLLRLIEGSHQLQQHREMTEPTGAWQALTKTRPADAIDVLRRRRYRVLSAPPLFQADRWPWADLFSLLTYGSGLLLLTGLLITHLWGWRFEGLTIQNGEQITLPGTEKWVALDDDARTVTHSPGLVTFVQARGPGLRASATDNAGRSLALQQTSETDPVTELTLALTEDQYFAIPEAQLIIRLTPQPGQPIEAHSPVLVQVFRSPPGRLATEIIVEGEAEFTVDEVTLKLTSVPHARVTAAFNPGLWPTSAALVLLAVGLVGSAAWPIRRLWLRERSDHIEGTGDLPPALTEGKDA